MFTLVSVVRYKSLITGEGKTISFSFIPFEKYCLYVTRRRRAPWHWFRPGSRGYFARSNDRPKESESENPQKSPLSPLSLYQPTAQQRNYKTISASFEIVRRSFFPSVLRKILNEQYSLEHNIFLTLRRLACRVANEEQNVCASAAGSNGSCPCFLSSGALKQRREGVARRTRGRRLQSAGSPRRDG